MSGLGLRAEGEGFRIVKIHRVIPGSAADSAGLREGDEIRAIDGRPAAEMTLDGIYRLLRQEGRSLLFATVRAGQRRTVKLILRRLA
jgi:C-terminal processing protease CtpA/Prc